MTTTTSNHPEEAKIKEKFIKFLNEGKVIEEPKRPVIFDSVTGSSYKVDRDHKRIRQFVREFDIAYFSFSWGKLLLYGFEVKGWRFDGDRWSEPLFGDGIDQALVMLKLGADHAYVVYPELAEKEDRDALKELCDHFARNVGIYFVKNDLSSAYLFRAPDLNPYSTVEMTRITLTNLIDSGIYRETTGLPDWARNQEY
jgi:hypothetical protein